jgi:hypothetical protein
MFDIFSKFKFLKEKSIAENYWRDNDFDGKITQSLRWMGGLDTPEKYEEEGNKSYVESDILYEINEHWFRTSTKSNNVIKDNTVACFGCSNTVGVGLPWEETWPFYLNRNLGEDWSVKNYGISGGSNDQIARLVYKYVSNNNPKAICCFLTDSYRIEAYQTGIFMNYSERKHAGVDVEIHDGYLKFYNEHLAIYNFIKNQKFIEAICKSRNIQFYWYTWSEDILNLINYDLAMDKTKSVFNLDNFLDKIKIEDFNNYLPRARDGAHYGKYAQEQLAYEFTKKILKHNAYGLLKKY